MTKKEQEDLEKAMTILEEFNRAGISYRICEDGSFDFYSDRDYKRAQEVIKQIESKQ